MTIKKNIYIFCNTVFKKLLYVDIISKSFNLETVILSEFIN